MSISYPFDLLDGFPGWCTKFELYRRQETSRSVNGKTYVKDLGDPLWSAAYVSKNLRANALDRWRARLDALEDGLQTFIGRPLSRCRPQLYPGTTGGALSGVTVSSVSSTNKRLALDGLPANFKFLAGDMIEVVNSGLYRLVEDRTANSSGLTALFEVRPHFWPGVTAGAEVKIVNPSCVMSIVPGSVSSDADPTTGRGTISFEAIEARDA